MRIVTVIALLIAMLTAPAALAGAGIAPATGTDCAEHMAGHQKPGQPAKTVAALCCAALQIALPADVASGPVSPGERLVRALVDLGAPARDIEPAVPPPRA